MFQLGLELYLNPYLDGFQNPIHDKEVGPRPDAAFEATHQGHLCLN